MNGVGQSRMYENSGPSRSSNALRIMIMVTIWIECTLAHTKVDFGLKSPQLYTLYYKSTVIQIFIPR